MSSLWQYAILLSYALLCGMAATLMVYGSYIGVMATTCIALWAVTFGSDIELISKSNKSVQ